MALEKKKLWQDFLMYFLFWLHPGAAPRQQCKTFDFVVLFNFCLMFFNCFKKIEDEKIVTFLLWLDPGAAPGQQCSPGFSPFPRTFPFYISKARRAAHTQRHTATPSYPHFQILHQNTIHLEREYILPETEIHFTLIELLLHIFKNDKLGLFKTLIAKFMCPHLKNLDKINFLHFLV